MNFEKGQAVEVFTGHTEYVGKFSSFDPTTKLITLTDAVGRYETWRNETIDENLKSSFITVVEPRKRRTIVINTWESICKDIATPVADFVPLSEAEAAVQKQRAKSKMDQDPSISGLITWTPKT